MTLETVKIEQQQKRPTLMIATPMYGGMCTGSFMVGVLQTINKMQSVGVQVYFVQMGNESLITRARNELTRIFLEKDFDYLMFIDADIGFDAEAVYTLMAANKDIVCGIYPKKEVDWTAVEKAVAQGKTTNLKDYSGAFVLNFAHELGQELHTDETGCIEVRHGGTGFMLIKKDVFHKLADKVPSYRPSTVKDANGNYLKPEVKEFFATSIDESGCLLSEDYHFCELHRKHGGKIHVNPFIKLEHVGTYIYGGDIIKAGGNLKMSLPEIQLATDGDLNYALFKHNDIVSNHVRRGGYETELQTETAKLLANCSSGIVLDIGANLGSYTVPVAKAHPHLQFHVFEPQRIIYYQLCANVFLNRLDNVYAYQYGLSDAEWAEPMVMPDYDKESNIGAFSVDPAVREKDYEVQTEGATEFINCVKLDLLKLTNVRLIKIDVEGHELEALSGAYETLQTNNFPPIIFESWTWKFPEKRAKLMAYLQDLGYEITNIGQNNLAVKK